MFFHVDILGKDWICICRTEGFRFLDSRAMLVFSIIQLSYVKQTGGCALTRTCILFTAIPDEEQQK